jgi:hypothetical protein
MVDVIIDEVNEKSNALKALEKMKKYEKTITMHRLQLNDRTVVYCKNEDRIEQYKKLK